ncbi:MAG: V-type ATP synthase subunit D [Treponema sp.]|nr:V-type ATP synthase subunit D [Treponema sp.]
MAQITVAPTKSNLLITKEQLAVSTNGYELLEEKREILVRELMSLVEQVKLLEDEIQQAIDEAYPAFKRMLMIDGADQVERISHGIHYDFDMIEKTVAVGGMQFETIEVELPKKELFYSFLGTYANTDEVIVKFFNLLTLLTQMASIRTIVWRLAEEVKRTQRRVNALDKMIIPQATETIKYIESVLEERERENVFVLKALKKKKERGTM